MDTKEFKKAVELLVKEKGISEDIIYDAMELAHTTEYKKNYHSLSNVRVDINSDKTIDSFDVKGEDDFHIVK